MISKETIMGLASAELNITSMDVNITSTESQYDHFGYYIRSLLYVVWFSFKMKRTFFPVDVLILFYFYLLKDRSAKFSFVTEEYE